MGITWDSNAVVRKLGGRSGLSSSDFPCSGALLSFSSYSSALQQSLCGKYKEVFSHFRLKLALVFGETYNLQFYYRKLAGLIPDTETAKSVNPQI